jgi:lysophospholipase L1-like esterase
VTVVFIGDSVTDCGREIEQPFGDGYVREISLSRVLKDPLINVGTSGHRLIDLEMRWQQDVLNHRPTILSIAIGINDTWRRYDDNDSTSVEEFRDRYHRLLTLTREAINPQFVLCEPFLLHVREEMKTWREDLDPKIEVVHDLVREFGGVLVPFDLHLNELARIMPITAIAEDGIHPTSFGHQVMAKLWLSSIA